MSGRTSHVIAAAAEKAVHNKAQEERAAADDEPKRLADTPDLADKETWAHPAGHSGTHRAWAVSVAMLASFLLAGEGLTFGPRVLLWIGVGLFVALGVLGLAMSAWTDFVRERAEGESADAGEAP